MTSRLGQRRLVSNKEVLRKYFALPSYGSKQNQGTSAYRIGNQNNITVL